MKKTIPVIHQLARTGGTIIGRCIGSMRGVTLLSEINPRGKYAERMLDPIYQGEHWFKLLTPDQADKLRERNADFCEIIDVLYEEAAARDNQLVVRDWTHVDYFDWPVPSPPQELSLESALHANFNVRSICVVRHPLTQWLSWRRYRPENPISISEFLSAYIRFAERAFEIGFVRYEDFCSNPDASLQSICQSIGIKFDPSYEENWTGYLPISGDDYVYLENRKIHKTKSRSIPPSVVQQFLKHKDYFYAVELFNYAPLGKPTSEIARGVINQPIDGEEHDSLTDTGKAEPDFARISIKEAARKSRNKKVIGTEKIQIAAEALSSVSNDGDRVFLIDPSITNDLGHHFSLASALRSEAEDLNKHCIILANNQITDKLSALDAFAYFGVSGFNSDEKGNEVDNFGISMRENQLFSEFLARLPRSTFRPSDFVFFPTVTPSLILAIIGWAVSFESKHRPKVGVCLMFPPDWHTSLRLSATHKQFYSAAFSLLHEPSLADSIVFTTETTGLADLYRKEFGIHAIPMPTPTLENITTDMFEARGSAKSSSQIVISSIGNAREEKGTHLLPEVFDALTKAGHDIVLNVQVTGYDQDYIENVSKNLRNHVNVHQIVEPLDRESFSALIAGSDIMLLPYDKKKYYSRGSALFNEAHYLGVPVVVPAGTDIGGEAENRGTGVTFNDWDAAGVAEALELAISNLPTLKQNAKHSKDEFAARNGYLATLMRHFEK